MSTPKLSIEDLHTLLRAAGDQDHGQLSAWIDEAVDWELAAMIGDGEVLSPDFGPSIDDARRCWRRRDICASLADALSHMLV